MEPKFKVGGDIVIRKYEKPHKMPEMPEATNKSKEDLGKGTSTGM